MSTDDLDRILAHWETRTFQFKQVVCQIQSQRPAYALRHARVTVCQHPNGQVTILCKNQPLAYTIYQKPTRQADIVDTKTLDRQIKPQSPLAPITPGGAMAAASTANPLKRSLPMR